MCNLVTNFLYTREGGRSGYTNVLSCCWREKKRRRTPSSLTDISEEEGVGRGEEKGG